MINKEYFVTYYKNHKKEYQRRDKRWRKNNPERVKEIKKKYLEKLLGKRKTIINKSNYGKKTLKDLFIESYSKKLGKKKDNVTKYKHNIKMVCIDCIYYKRGRILKGCPGWDECPFKKEILEEINKKGG